MRLSRPVNGQLFILVLIALLLLLEAPLAFLSAQTAYAGAADDEVYDQLKSGKRIVGERTYAEPEKPTVYLTFDDGPSKLTGQVLDILKQEEVKATFFQLGIQAQQYPDYVRRVVEEGHALGNHTFNHVYNQLYTSFDTFWEQVQKTEQIFDDIVGVRPQLVRAPGGTAGNFDPFYFYYLEQAGYTVVDWNIDSSDATRAGVPSSEILNVIRKGPFRHEVVLLMHDGTGHEQTVKALPDIIALFKNKGYEFAPLTDAVKPVVFSNTKTKWSRSNSRQSFAANVEAAESHRIAYMQPKADPNEAIAGSDPVSDEMSVSTLIGTSASAAPPLLLGVGDRELTIGEVWSAGGEMRVRLRDLVERLGGKVEWDAERRTAHARLGMYEVQYDMSRHEIRVLGPGHRLVTHPLASMELSEGSIRVPLAGALDMYGFTLTKAEGDAGRMRVAAAHTNPFLYPLPVWRNTAFRTGFAMAP